MNTPKAIAIGQTIKNCFFNDAIVTKITFTGTSSVDGADYCGGYAKSGELEISFSIDTRYNWKTENGTPIDAAGFSWRKNTGNWKEKQ